MRVPLSWLQDFAPFPEDPAVVAAALDGLGLVVEQLHRIGGDLDGIVVARVLATRPHPDADRIQLVDVDTGDGAALQICCGAFNMQTGDLVPLATLGTRMPGTDITIERRKMRGQWSNGMLCSGRELWLSDDHGGIHVLPPTLEPGMPFAEAMGIGRDAVFDVDVTANRPDAMCVAGVARDLAASMALPFAVPAPSVARSGAGVATAVSVVVEAGELCPRFTATVIRGITVGPGDDRLGARLTLAGMRPINNVVDVSNYVMLELGQPNHAYDLATLAGSGILVRAARPGETIETLDGVVRTVGTRHDCLICDAEGTAIGIGGIMGGASTEIGPSTVDVVLEAAWFDPMSVAWTSKRLNLRTEASARFERGVDIEGIDRAVERFCELLGVGVVAPGTIDVRTAPPAARRVQVRTARVNALLGSDLEDDRIRSLLAPIGFDSAVVTPGVLDVGIPSWRPDCAIEVDIVEEVGRHHGYANLPRTVPSGVRTGGLTAFQQARRRVRDVLAGVGASEATNPPLLGPGDHERAGIRGGVIEADNPMIREESVLRRSMLPGLLRGLAFNASHRNPDVSLFEIGKVFLPPVGDAPLPDERERLAFVAAGPGVDAAVAVAAWRTLAGALRLADTGLEATDDADGLHPTRTCRVLVDGRAIGHVGEVDPDVAAGHDLSGRVAWLEVELEALLTANTRSLESRPVSRFPSSDVDLAFLVPDDVPAAAVESALRSDGGDLLVDLRLFDVYRGAGLAAGERSLAFRLRFQAIDRTLTDAEVAAARQACIDAVTTATNAHLRA